MTLESYRMRRRGPAGWWSSRGPAGHVEHLAWLSSRHLLVVGWLEESLARASVGIELVAGGASRRAELALYRYDRPDLARLGKVKAILGCVAAQRGAIGAKDLTGLAIEDGRRSYRWLPRRGGPIAPDLEAWLAEVARAWPRSVASPLVREIGRLTAEVSASEGEADPTLLRNLAALLRHFEAELLDDPEPRWMTLLEATGMSRASRCRVETPDAALLEGPCVVAPRETLGVATEAIIELDSEHVFLRGWLWDPERSVEGIDLVSPDFGEIEIGALNRIPRPDVEEVYRPSFGSTAEEAHGFWITARCPWIGEAEEAFLRLRTRRGPRWLRTLPVVRDPFRGRHLVFGGLPAGAGATTRRMLDVALREAIQRLSERCRVAAAAPAPTFDWDFRPIGSPFEVSLVLPLVSGLYLEPQLAALADDPEVSGFEIVAVVDLNDPTPIERELFQLARHYGLAVRLVAPGQARGWSAAVECGVRASRGRVVGLLHADTFPEGDGSIGRLIAALDHAAVVGPALVFEDGTLASGPIGFRRDLHADGGWTPVAEGRGLVPERTGKVSGATSAVSGAALFLRRATYFEAGGLLDLYPAGDGDDLDLCLRCQALGGVRFEDGPRWLHLEGRFRTVAPGWCRNPWASIFSRSLFGERWASSF